MKWRRRAQVACRYLDDEAVLVPVRTAVDQPLKVHALNPVATRVWSLLDGTRDEAALVAEVLREFEVDEATATADVRGFVEELARSGLVEAA